MGLQEPILGVLHPLACLAEARRLPPCDPSPVADGTQPAPGP